MKYQCITIESRAIEGFAGTAPKVIGGPEVSGTAGQLTGHLRRQEAPYAAESRSGLSEGTRVGGRNKEVMAVCKS